jgi:FlaA1/EpsC-like NDP-sugar epimerase
VIDVCFLIANGLAARMFSGDIADLRALASGPRHLMEDRYGAFLLLDICLILLMCEWERLYRTPLTRNSTEEFGAVARAVSFATVPLITIVYLFGVSIAPREAIAVSALLNIASLSAWRYAKRRVVLRRAERGIGARNALIVGAGKVGQALAAQLASNTLLGYKFVGFLDGNHVTDPRILGKLEDLRRVVREKFIDEVFITVPSERELVKQVVHEARQQRLCVNVIPELYDGLGCNAPLHHVGDFPVMDLHWRSDSNARTSCETDD